jgi:selenocysteine lyase/cysteine desulfurase
MVPVNSPKWRREFPVTERYIYLDHAHLGPMPHAAAEAISESARAQAQEGSLILDHLFENAEQLRGEFAAFLQVNPDELACLPNTSTGISIVANGFDWQKGDSVVFAENEFPSVIYPWMALRKRGVEVRPVSNETGPNLVDDLLAACDRSTRAIAVSWVRFDTGFRIDLWALGNACRERGIMLVVDGMQGVGALSLRLGELPVDALATQSFKWLLGPHGVGWLYIRKELLDKLQPSVVGHRSVTARDSFLDHTFELRPDAARFESGNLNLHAIPGAAASLRLITQVGIAAVENSILSLTERLAQGLLSKGYLIRWLPVKRIERSGITTFWHPRHDPLICFKRLSDARIVTSFREGAIRASPHFYNTTDEIDFLIDTLP